MEDKIKEVLVMRVRYPDGNSGTRKVRQGKMISQGAHAAMGFIARRIRMMANFKVEPPKSVEFPPLTEDYQRSFELAAQNEITNMLGDEEVVWRLIPMTKSEAWWFDNKFAKITCGVHTEEELMALYDQAIAAGLTASLIIDAGDTEFGGVRTPTGISIGPDLASKIDPITGQLPLL